MVDFQNKFLVVFDRFKPEYSLSQGKTFFHKACQTLFQISRSSGPEVFLGKGVLIICSNFTGEHPCRSTISIKFQSNFIEIARRDGCSFVNMLHIFRAPFPSNNSAPRLILLQRENNEIKITKFCKPYEME